MKLLTVDLDLDCLEFVDRFGIVRTVYGCSILGLDEFKARLAQLQSLLRSAQLDATLADLYRKDRLFHHHCDRCLQLNGIDPDWLDGKGLLLERLLFAHEDGHGLLVRLNTTTPDKGATTDPNAEPATVYDAAAALLTLSSDLTKVIDQLKTIPAKQVNGIIEAKVKYSKTPEDKKKEERKQWAAKLRSRPSTPIVINK